VQERPCVNHSGFRIGAIRTIIRQVCKELGVQIVSGVLSREHVHMFVEIPPHIAVSDFAARQGTVIASGPDGVPGLAQALLGAEFLGSGLLLHHERQHHARCHTSVSSGARTYRRQPVVIQFSFSGKQPDNGSLSTVFHLPFYLALLHWRKIGQNEAEKLSEFNWRFSAFSPKAA
jgi:Transposase IS200 like